MTTDGVVVTFLPAYGVAEPTPWIFAIGRAVSTAAAGIAVVNTGHRHPKVIQAVKDQLDRFTHTCHQVVPYENYVALAERLNRLVPGDFEKKTIFATTGAEAVENASRSPALPPAAAPSWPSPAPSTAAPSWA